MHINEDHYYGKYIYASMLMYKKHVYVRGRLKRLLISIQKMDGIFRRGQALKVVGENVAANEHMNNSYLNLKYIEFQPINNSYLNF